MKWFLARGLLEDMPKEGDKVTVEPREPSTDTEWAVCKSSRPERDCYVLKPTSATGKAYVTRTSSGNVDRMSWLEKPENSSDYGIALVMIG